MKDSKSAKAGNLQMKAFMRNKYPVMIVLITFITGYIFFTQIGTLIIADGDDWISLSHYRTAVPMWGYFLPSRVLPEILMAAAGYASGYVVMPFTGDYIQSVTMVSAFLVSVCISLYMLEFYLLLRRSKAAEAEAFLLTLLFLVFHFVIFRRSSPCRILFSSDDLTCMYFYMIPDLLNLILVLHCVRHEHEWENLSACTVREGVFLMFVYLAIFSGLFSNIIFISYVGIRLLYQILLIRKEHGSRREWIRTHWPSILCILVFLIAVLFEAGGGRTRQIGSMPVDLSFLKYLQQTISAADPLFILFAGGVTVWGIYFLLRQKVRRDNRDLTELMGMFMLCYMVTFLFQFLLSSRAGYHYLYRSDIMLARFAFLLMILILMLRLIFAEVPAARMGLPLILLVLLVECTDGRYPYSTGIDGNYPAAAIRSLDREIIREVNEADAKGRSSMELHVPVGFGLHNWPYPVDYMGKGIADTLFRDGVTDHRLEISIVPDQSLNDKYCLQIYR
jgi:hypothetical protein